MAASLGKAAVMAEPGLDEEEKAKAAAGGDVELDVLSESGARSSAASSAVRVEVPPEEQFTWDICLVFAVGSDEKKVQVRLEEGDDEDAGLKRKREKKRKKKEKKEKAAAAKAGGEKREKRDKAPPLAEQPPSSTRRRLKNGKFEMLEKDFFRLTTLNTLERLEAAGLETSVYHSVQEDEVFCLVGATEARLRREADRVDYDLELDLDQTIEEGARVGVRLCCAVKRGEVTTDGWHRLYGKYDPDQMPAAEAEALRAVSDGAAIDTELPDDPSQHAPEDAVLKSRLYRRYDEGPRHPNSLFKTVDRLKLIDNIMEADTLAGGAGFSPEGMAENKKHSGIAYFPLHQEDRREELVRRWLDPRKIFDQPIEGIRDYYGEKIAIYFAFLQFYLRQLVVPGVVGLGMFAWQMAEGRVDVDGAPFYAVLVALWASFMLELWKRKESVMRVEWGQSSFLHKEQPRPQFWGELRRSPVDGTTERDFPLYERVRRAMASQAVIWVLIMMVIASVVGLFLFRKVASNHWGDTQGTFVTAIVNAVMIQILNAVYGGISRSLNDYENHRTATEYENSLIAKSFLFKFVNSYNTLFYIAFFKKNDDFTGGCGGCLDAKLGCSGGECLDELQIQLGTIFVTMIVVNNTMELVVPMIKGALASRANRAHDDDDDDGIPDEIRKSSAEEQFELESYDSTFDDFDELALQFGFVSLFVLAFPLAPTLALANNIIEVQVDARKLAHHARRPEPSGAANIGTWYTVYEIIGVISVFTNLALIVFETEPLDRWSDRSELNKVWIFLIAEHVILILKVVIAAAVPDEPSTVADHELRQKYLQGVLIQGAAEEEEDDDLAAIAGAEPDEHAWAARTRGKAVMAHSWEYNSHERLAELELYRAEPDEKQEFVTDDRRMCLQLRKSMQEQCVGGGFNLQPPSFWMLYDLFYLGAIFAAQRVWIEYKGNDQLTEPDALALIQGRGGVREVAFADPRFAAYMRWWVSNRQPRWAIFLNVDDNAITTDWLSERVPQVEPTVEWRFSLELDQGVIIVRPEAW